MRRLWDTAFLMRYGGQDFYRIQGRDPITQPMTSLEIRLLNECIQEMCRAQYKGVDGEGTGAGGGGA